MFIVKERDSDEDLSEEDRIQVQRTRSIYALSLLTAATFIALVLNFVIKEDLRRLRYSKDEKTEIDTDKGVKAVDT